MKLNHGLHLAYCTNVHRGENWEQTFKSLEEFTLPVRRQVCPNSPYAIGLRLSDTASRELSDEQALTSFRRWLDRNDCYVFTINGFPFGKFHGTRVKEQVYLPDWTSEERLEYTNRLFSLLAQLLPSGVDGSVSTLPGSFKEFITRQEQTGKIYSQLLKCARHIAELSEKHDKPLHLGLEPEPLGLFENVQETIGFFDGFRNELKEASAFNQFLGLNYDTCHLAIEYENPRDAFTRFQAAGIRISKIHLSNALKLTPSSEARRKLASFSEDVYLHQVIARGKDGTYQRYKDLPEALTDRKPTEDQEWRVHFHIPLHSNENEIFHTTSDHLKGVLDLLQENPRICSHLEMETYTWEVMPHELKKKSVVDQIVAEYGWTLEQLSARNLFHHA